jgi:hypothetical protein
MYIFVCLVCLPDRVPVLRARLCVCRFVCVCLFPFFLSACLSECLPASQYLSVCLSTCLPSTLLACLSDSLPVGLLVCLSVCFSFRLSVSLSLCFVSVLK